LCFASRPGLFLNSPKIWSKRYLGDGFGIVEIALLPCRQGLHVDGRNNARLKAELAQRPIAGMRV
jgi:hypothetical protein